MACWFWCLWLISHFVLIPSPISIVRLSILMMQQINIAESLFEWGYIADNWWYTVSFCITRWRKGGNNLIEVLFDLNFLFPVQSVMIILNQFQLTRHSIVPMIKQFLWPSDTMSCPSTTQTHDHRHQDYHWLPLFWHILYPGTLHLGCGRLWSITICYDNLYVNCISFIFCPFPSRSGSQCIASLAISMMIIIEYIPNTPSDDTP